MKKLFFFALVAILAGCKDEVKVFQLDPNAMISIRPAGGAFNASMKVKSTEAHLSALEIVKQTTNMSFYNDSVFGESVCYVNFAGRDTINLSLKRWGADIIDIDGNYVSDFIKARDCVFVIIKNDGTPNITFDTVAYIPNSTLRDADKNIKFAYTAKDNETVYSLFDKAFTFTPITGAEWRALKALNLQ